MDRIRALAELIHSDRRATIGAGVVIFLVLAGITGLPARLGSLPTGEPVATRTAPTGEPTSEDSTTVDRGELGGPVTAENRGLDRCVRSFARVASCGPAPALRRGVWVNTDGTPTIRSLRGSVVLVDFFSGSCISCRRDSRYLRAWDAAYRSSGLRILGVHTPSFEFENSNRYVADVVRELSIRFPVLHDESRSTVTAYRSPALPAKYLIDATGTVRSVTVGENGHRQVEAQIRELLKQARPGVALPARVGKPGDGLEAARSTTPTLPLNDFRRAGFDVEVGGDIGRPADYDLDPSPQSDTYSLGGRWTIGPQLATTTASSSARVSFRGRRVYQLIGGRGTLVASAPGTPDRTITVDGSPRLRQIYRAPEAGRQALTVHYSRGLEVYAFSFG